jgi:DNA invertase Pin-like site-specific DNA recombinase
MLVAVFAWVSEQERRRIRQRMQAKKVEVLKNGGRWGRPRKVDAMTLAAAKKLRDTCPDCKHTVSVWQKGAGAAVLCPKCGARGLSLRVVAARLKVKKATLQRALAAGGK